MKLEVIKDVNNKDYIGINVPAITVLNKPLLTLISAIGYTTAIDCLTKLTTRNGGYKFHCTVFNVAECGIVNNLSTRLNQKHFSDLNLDIDFIKNIIDQNIDYDLKLEGIGMGTNDKGDKTYFIVCSCSELNKLREKYGLEPKDLHITIGFTNKDIFNIDKSTIKWKI